MIDENSLTIKKLEQTNLKLKMELMTIIMGYEKELRDAGAKDMSDFSKGCMERYFQIANEIKGQNE